MMISLKSESAFRTKGADEPLSGTWTLSSEYEERRMLSIHIQSHLTCRSSPLPRPFTLTPPPHKLLPPPCPCRLYSGPTRNIQMKPHASLDGKIQPLKLDIPTITSTLLKAQKAWDKGDKDKNGSLSLKECVDLLNSAELRDAVRLTLNVEPKLKTEAEIKPLFEKADKDKSGGLSRTEFLALFLAVVTDRVKANPLVLAEALLGFLDVDRNGKIEGGELKVLLAILGFPAAVLLPIPSFIGIDYRGIIKGLGGK